ADSGGGRVRLISRHSGKAVSGTDRSTADGATVSQLTDNNQHNQQWETVAIGTGGGTTPPPCDGGTTLPPSTQCCTGAQGWATQGGGTTGGGSSAVTTVTSASALTSAISGSNRVVRVQGTISCSGMLRVGSNITIEGASGSRIQGCGLNIRQATNVIVRNLSF